MIEHPGIFLASDWTLLYLYHNSVGSLFRQPFRLPWKLILEGLIDLGCPILDNQKL